MDGLETTGKNLSTSCPPFGKDEALRLLNAAIDASAIPRKVLAEDLCGMSQGNFSKVTSGEQGDVFSLVFRLPTDVRRDFFDRLVEADYADPLERAAEQLALAAVRFLRTRRRHAHH